MGGASGKPAPAADEENEEYIYTLRRSLFPDVQSEDLLRVLLRDEQPSEVFSEGNGFKVFVGNFRHAEDLPALEQRGITHVVNMAAAESLCKMTQEVYGPAYTCLFIRANDLDSYDISVHFDEVCEFLEGARALRTGVLVHCVAGVSRSVTVVISYLMKFHGMSLAKAARHVHSHRPQAYPNNNFIKCLVRLDRERPKPRTKN